MEKVIITKCDTIMGGKAHGVTLADGRQCTAWNDKIDGGLLMQAYASHKSIAMEIKPWGDANKGGNNIIALGEVDASPVVETIQAAPQETQGSKIPTTGDSIVAQVCVKSAVELAKTKNYTSNEELGEFLSMAVVEIAGAYRLALNQLQ